MKICCSGVHCCNPLGRLLGETKAWVQEQGGALHVRLGFTASQIIQLVGLSLVTASGHCPLKKQKNVKQMPIRHIIMLGGMHCVGKSAAGQHDFLQGALPS